MVRPSIKGLLEHGILMIVVCVSTMGPEFYANAEAIANNILKKLELEGKIAHLMSPINLCDPLEKQKGVLTIHTKTFLITRLITNLISILSFIKSLGQITKLQIIIIKI